MLHITLHVTFVKFNFYNMLCWVSVMCIQILCSYHHRRKHSEHFLVCNKFADVCWVYGVQIICFLLTFLVLLHSYIIASYKQVLRSINSGFLSLGHESGNYTFRFEFILRLYFVHVDVICGMHVEYEHCMFVWTCAQKCLIIYSHTISLALYAI